jgi:ribosomal protein S6--L-glutamate ligase
MKAALFSMGSKSSEWTVEAMKKYFDVVDSFNVKYVDVEISSEKTKLLYKGEEIGQYDCVMVKGSFRFATLLRSITEARFKESYLPLKASAFTVAHNKLITHLKMQHATIPMPKTYLSASIKSSKKILESMIYPIVMKLPSGTQGKGVMFAESFASASSMIDAMQAVNQPIIIQEYIETDGSDIRAFVVGDEVVASYTRKAVKGEKRANIHAGGTGHKVEIDKKTAKLAVTAAKSIGAEICGVDILPGPKGPLVIEINISPGLQGVTKVTGIDVADKIAQFLYNKTVEFKKSNLALEVGAKKTVGTKENKQSVKSIIDHVKIRSDKIVLPEFVNKIADFVDEDEVEITAEKGKVMIQESKSK